MQAPQSKKGNLTALWEYAVKSAVAHKEIAEHEGVQVMQCWNEADQLQDSQEKSAKFKKSLSTKFGPQKGTSIHELMQKRRDLTIQMLQQKQLQKSQQQQQQEGTGPTVDLTAEGNGSGSSQVPVQSQMPQQGLPSAQIQAQPHLSHVSQVPLQQANYVYNQQQQQQLQPHGGNPLFQPGVFAPQQSQYNMFQQMNPASHNTNQPKSMNMSQAAMLAMNNVNKKPPTAAAKRTAGKAGMDDANDKKPAKKRNPPPAKPFPQGQVQPGQMQMSGQAQGQVQGFNNMQHPGSGNPPMGMVAPGIYAYTCGAQNDEWYSDTRMAGSSEKKQLQDQELIQKQKERQQKRERLGQTVDLTAEDGLSSYSPRHNAPTMSPIRDNYKSTSFGNISLPPSSSESSVSTLVLPLSPAGKPTAPPPAPAPAAPATVAAALPLSTSTSSSNKRVDHPSSVSASTKRNVYSANEELITSGAPVLQLPLPLQVDILKFLVQYGLQGEQAVQEFLATIRKRP